MAGDPKPTVTLNFALRLRSPLYLLPGPDFIYVWLKAGKVWEIALDVPYHNEGPSPEMHAQILARFPNSVLLAIRELSARFPEHRIALGSTDRDTVLELSVYGWPGPLDVNSESAVAAFQAIGVALGVQ